MRKSEVFMDYWEYRIKPEAADLLEALLGLCSSLPFESFAEEAGVLHAWLPISIPRKAVERSLEDWRARIAFEWTVQHVPAQNWNAVWEANFDPVIVRRFCAVRAPFHDPITEVAHEVIIEPKMAFGTGHHETTWMMLDRMAHWELAQRSVLDYGCGTGVLAILAAMRGADPVVAVDVAQPAWESTVENAARNGVSQCIYAIHGTLCDVPQQVFDLILANINRNVILASLPALKRRMSPHSRLLVSGILEQDEARLLEAAATHGFAVEFRNSRGKWLCMELSPS